MMNELVQRLSQGNHPVEVSLRPKKTATALKERIDLGYIHIKFTNTQGGTELGVRLDPNACDWSQTDFDRPAGTIHLVGHLTLNYVKVKCIADVDLQTLEGQGHLEPIEPVSPAVIS
ncbi:MbtH domain protein [Egbenema bharatensis]|uniref:MbtH domain protein n=1 Tax=Egbenema bharatensis TaxID=3463334 RepID=UPI003A857E08